MKKTPRLPLHFMKFFLGIWYRPRLFGLPTGDCWEISRISKRQDNGPMFRPMSKLRNQSVTAKDPCHRLGPKRCHANAARCRRRGRARRMPQDSKNRGDISGLFRLKNLPWMRTASSWTIKLTGRKLRSSAARKEEANRRSHRNEIGKGHN
jgi:hypothetical protein